MNWAIQLMHTKASGVKAFHDFALFDNTSTMEYEANLFAADFLMEDSDVLDLLNDDLSFFGAAAKLNVPAELLDFKFRVLKRKGCQMSVPPADGKRGLFEKYRCKSR